MYGRAKKRSCVSEVESESHERVRVLDVQKPEVESGNGGVPACCVRLRGALRGFSIYDLAPHFGVINPNTASHA